MIKIKIFLVPILFCFCLFYNKIPNIYASEKQVFTYIFPFNSPRYYKIFLNGYISFSPQNIKPSRNEITGDFILKILNINNSADLTDKIYNLKIFPIKSMFSINGCSLENITTSDTEISKIIPEMDIEMDKRGKIINSKKRRALFDFIPFVKFFPSFPIKIVEGEKWTQIIPSFNSPLGKMPELEFTYVYMGEQNGLDKFNILSNQFFHQEENENNIKTKITGLNSSNGEILFDPIKGIIKSEKIHLNISVDFITDISTSKKKEKPNPIPYNVIVNVFLLIHSVNILG